MKFFCAQRGCEFEADSTPENCPVCNNPFLKNPIILENPSPDDELPWTHYSVPELRGYCESWKLSGWNSRTPKAGLIKLLEAAEAG